LRRHDGSRPRRHNWVGRVLESRGISYLCVVWVDGYGSSGISDGESEGFEANVGLEDCQRSRAGGGDGGYLGAIGVEGGFLVIKLDCFGVEIYSLGIIMCFKGDISLVLERNSLFFGHDGGVETGKAARRGQREQEAGKEGTNRMREQAG